MVSFYDSKILKVSDFYKRNILPRTECIRGMTRPNILLRDFGINQIVTREKNNYAVNFTDSESRRISDLDLLRKYVTLEYNQSCKIIDEIKNDTVFYDVGGFQGFHALIGSIGEKVYTFEPDPNNLDKLRENVELNQDQNIEIIEKPVWNKVEKINLVIGKEGESVVGNGELQKESITLDKFIIQEENTPPDLIKIDVEGAEQKVLEGAKNILDKYKPKIMIEIHDKNKLDRFDSSEDEIDEILKSKGYVLNSETRRDEETHKFFTAEI